MGRGFFFWAKHVLLACLLLAPSAANASTDFDMRLPQVFLDSITYDLTVSSPSSNGTPTSQPIPLLRIDNFLYTPSGSDGEWVFSDVSVTGTGRAVVTLELAGEVVQQAEVSAWRS